MTFRAKPWDLFWACLFFAGTLALVFYLLCLLIALAGLHVEAGAIAQRVVSFVAIVSYIVGPLATLWFISRWRIRRRALPVSMLWLEIVFGLLAATVLVVLIFQARGFPHP